MLRTRAAVESGIGSVAAEVAQTVIKCYTVSSLQSLWDKAVQLNEQLKK